jgi:hypothetical protein
MTVFEVKDITWGSQIGLPTTQGEKKGLMCFGNVITAHEQYTVG